ncbi:hypothetical protein GUJ93_ZPchr0012g21956 [Zizania palustris]|uniref:Uncharacterized protein n=1 Tax=Zizania palustris TaxID=103762 RepID=A0A8J5WSP5_ZIZPA|nr:hypothetical protein GUJ93_ZPchr0012g21956 [Zizania palustris]
MPLEAAASRGMESRFAAAATGCGAPAASIVQPRAAAPSRRTARDRRSSSRHSRLRGFEPPRALDQKPP